LWRSSHQQRIVLGLRLGKVEVLHLTILHPHALPLVTHGLRVDSVMAVTTVPAGAQDVMMI
jgi:hypothetical protein